MGGLLARRLRGLPVASVLSLEVPVAVGFRARLLGLAHLDHDEAGHGLLIPRCASVHTFGMRFALDVYFLDDEGTVIAAHREVPRRRLVARRGARAVLEVVSPERGSEGGRRPSPDLPGGRGSAPGRRARRRRDPPS